MFVYWHLCDADSAGFSGIYDICEILNCYEYMNFYSGLR